MTFYNIEAFGNAMRKLPAALLDTAMPELAKTVEDHLRRTIAAQQTPFGVPWPPRARGTAPVLVHAADAMTVSPIGRTIYMVLRGIEARHHKGAVRGSVQRQIILYKKDISKSAFKRAQRHAAKRGQTAVGMRGIPPKLFEAMQAVVLKHLEQWKQAA